MNQPEESSCKTSKTLAQTKLTYLYGNLSKAKSSCAPHNNADDCIVVEMAHQIHNFTKNHKVSMPVKAEEEERGLGNNFGAKRLHMEITSPRNDSIKSPTCTEEMENDVSGNGFVTARLKLVLNYYMCHIIFQFVITQLCCTIRFCFWCLYNCLDTSSVILMHT